MTLTTRPRLSVAAPEPSVGPEGRKLYDELYGQIRRVGPTMNTLSARPAAIWDALNRLDEAERLIRATRNALRSGL